MSIPVWVLLGFAAWTILTLLTTVGVYRWSRVLTGRAEIAEWRADEPQGSPWYRRAMRAHANCVENLPVYGAIVVAIVATGVHAPFLDRCALGLLGARVCQTLVHVFPEPTNFVATVRFVFYFAQLVAMIAMGVYVALHA